MNYTVYEDLFKPGTELQEFKFENALDWLINISDIKVHWRNHPTYILSQASFLFGAAVLLLHAVVRKGRLPYLYLSTILHGLVVESISYIHPDVDNFWHSQTPIIFLGRRLPLYIIVLYPVFIYNASVAVAKMRLPKWSEPFAVGLGAVLVDIPYDIVAVRFMHWTWHDTDPNIQDRHYWVPWNSYYFHATFAASFTFWFHFLREKICKTEGKWIAHGSVLREMVCCLLNCLLAAPCGVLMFVPIYHPLHDIFNIHSEVTFFIIFAIFLLFIWSGDRRPKPSISSYFNHWTTYLITFSLALHYMTFWIITVFFNPEDESVTGLREPIGPCNEYAPLTTALGMTVRKRKYLCATDYDEGYFDWSCLPKGKPPSNGSVWYTICGVPLKNRVEYISIITILMLVAAVVFGNAHYDSSGDLVFNEKAEKIVQKKGDNKKKRH